MVASPAFCTETMQQWPMIEDLLQHPAFLRYTEWRLQAGLPVDEPLGPSHLDKAGRYATRVSAGRQDGAMAHKAALPPVVSFGLSPDAHLKAALEASARPSPLQFPWGQRHHRGGQNPQLETRKPSPARGGCPAMPAAAPAVQQEQYASA